ncbi:NADH-quinone oxidoreductase subunit J [Horticoccus luteus]|uniref:NADH-quinone oxidoreductase subunit J n=1 Tax=Horticoccus luteus TaxID=2862869 RepID=A0A8F9XKQ6_9BACT|nr:NADH-quinone oxidoreductase subunit J [Horticoccus luteus]QYM78294.1 NADH-quinone oxidoreductase subunit J [Horticoccus luteus]
MSGFMFYILSALTLVCAVGVIVNRNAVNAAMCLLLSLVGVAGLFGLLQAYLLAVLLVLVYAGAVVALFLFIVMLLDVQGGARKPFGKVTAIAATAALALMVAGACTIAGRPEITDAQAAADAIGAPLKNYAYQLFTTYLLPVQVVGFLLLIAMLGVIVLSKRFDGLEDIK